jgi:lysophospholipase L1-like esterase
MKIQSAGLLILSCIGLVTLQAWWLKRRTPRLMPARGQSAGECIGENNTDAVRVLVLGDSSAVGVGVQSTKDALAAHIAAEVARRHGGRVHWATRGKSGAKIKDLSASVATGGGFDFVVVAAGVNDVLHLRSPIAWKQQLQRLIKVIQAQTGAKLIVLLPMPPLWKFAALPIPLRLLLGLEALLLDFATRAVARRSKGVEHLPIGLTDQRTMLSVDRFHPSSVGYMTIARPVARLIARSVAPNFARRRNG